jgi:hypothetical protein
MGSFDMRIGKKAVHAAKVVLARAGSKAPSSIVRVATLANGYFAIGHWLAKNGFDISKTVHGGRKAVFQAIAERISPQRVLYLEFGVFEGASLRFWSNALHNPESQLHGFDSFEGLPETFDAAHPMGFFNTSGHTPTIDDSRITYHVGLFKTLCRHFKSRSTTNCW